MSDVDRLPNILADITMLREKAFGYPQYSISHYQYLKMAAGCVRTWRACGGKLRGVK